jgi:hypothetical protein
MIESAPRFRVDGGPFGPADPVVIEQFFRNGIHRGRRKAPADGAARRR